MLRFFSKKKKHQELAVKKIGRDKKVFNCPPTMGPDECEREISKRIKVEIVADINSFPPFKGVLSSSHGQIAIPLDYQNRMALLDLGDNKVWAVALDQIYATSYFRSLVARAEDMGFIIVKKTKITVGCLSRLNEKFLMLDQKASASENRDSYEETKSQAFYLFEEIIGEAVKANASDVHVCVRFVGNDPTGVVRFRIHGLLHKFETYPSDQLQTMLSVAYGNTTITDKLSRSREAFNPRENQSCAMKVSSQDVVHGKSYVELRYQHLTVRDGFDAIIRILSVGDDATKVDTLEDLGYSASQENMLRIAARKTIGAIFISGVTGSGKTTTLKTLLTMDRERNSKKKTYTIEDPPEYKLPGISQISVQRSNDKTSQSPFAAAMKDVMRADPDRIMVGEVRDQESASMLQTMVQSGHQVFASVHASGAFGIVSRLVSSEIGLSIQTLASDKFLSLLVYQRLLPVSCPKCKIPARNNVPEAMLKFLVSVNIDISQVYVRNPDGCPACKNRGTIGQTVCAEIVELDNVILRYLRKGQNIEAVNYWRQQRRSPFNDSDSVGKTAFEHALYKISIGSLDPRDVEDAFEPFERYEIVEVELPEHKSAGVSRVVSLKNQKEKAANNV
jgi:type II secretory ATPase GspE/PulE/Tfp pilus assembly ATPase PilB-like protein